MLAPALALAVSTASERGFTTRVSAGAIARYTQQFGKPVPQRIERWFAYAREHKDAGRDVAAAGAAGLLQAVNIFFNRARFRSDAEHWGAEDYWATPAQTVASDGADCEDFAIAKYFFLKEIGFPVERLRITYVSARGVAEPHMVLAYYARPEDEPLILDNLQDAVLPASARQDLRPVYSFNDEDVQMAQGGRRASPLQIRAWRALVERLDAEGRL